MSLFFKRVIFWGLLTAFLGYSWVVYTSGTDYPKRKELYTEKAQYGKIVFQKYNCISCHQIYGLGGYMGPDITNVITKEGKGENFAKAFIMAGSNRMPNFQLEKDEINALIAYLTYIGESSDYSVEKFKTTWYGTIVPVKNTLSNEE